MANSVTQLKPIIVALTGASGVTYGIEILRTLKALGRETHLVVTEAAARTLSLETDWTVADVKALATQVHSNKDIAASISSGSFPTAGMIIAPCSIKTLSGIVNAYGENLVIRAADVCLKERRRLVLMIRECPLHKGHLELMTRAADYGAIILPPMPAFYHRPESLDDIVRQGAGKALDQFDIAHDLYAPWTGP
ncbi:MAG: UbiX family flavin prenyltransferase [Magnetospiraceae bacterium]